MEALLAARTFTARAYGVPAPTSSVSAEVSAARAAFPKVPLAAARLLMFQEGCWGALRSNRPGKPAAWRKRTLAQLGRSSGDDALDERTARFEIVLAPVTQARQAAVRHGTRPTANGSAMVQLGAMNGIFAGIYGSR